MIVRKPASTVRLAAAAPARLAPTMRTSVCDLGQRRHSVMKQRLAPRVGLERQVVGRRAGDDPLGPRMRQQTRDGRGDVARVAAGQPLHRAGGRRSGETVQIEVHVAVEAAAQRVVERIDARVIAIHEPVRREVVEGRLQIEEIEMLHRQHAEELGVVLLEADRIGDDAGLRRATARARPGLDVERPAARLVRPVGFPTGGRCAAGTRRSTG